MHELDRHRRSTERGQPPGRETVTSVIPASAVPNSNKTHSGLLAAHTAT